MHNAKSRTVPLLLALLLAFLPLNGTHAAFSSMYVFGDGVSATNDPSLVDDGLGYSVDGLRNCNGKVWVELLWQWQGHAFDNAKNFSKWGNYSYGVVDTTANLAPPPDAATSLFVVWCANADFVDFLNTQSAEWTTFINASVARHVQIVTNLYNKGVRTVVLPSAVDFMTVPYYNTATIDKAFVRQQVQAFNAQLKSTLGMLPGQLAAQHPANSRLVLHFPDAFTFFDQVLAHPEGYGLVNPYPYNSALYDLDFSELWSEPASSYIFWDLYHPTAKFQMHLAAFFQQAIFPPKVNSIAVNGGTVDLQVVNIPLGRNGSVQGCADMQSTWQQEVAISEPAVVGGSTTKTFPFPTSGTKRFYRVGFPVVWAWP